MQKPAIYVQPEPLVWGMGVPMGAHQGQQQQQQTFNMQHMSPMMMPFPVSFFFFLAVSCAFFGL